MERIKVKIINKSHHPLPAYATNESAGMDVRAYLPNGPVTLNPCNEHLSEPGYICNFLQDMNARYALAPD